MKFRSALFSVFTVSMTLCLILPVWLKKEEIKRSAFEFPTKALDALQFLSAMAAYPNKDIPADGYAKAFTYTKDNFSGLKIEAQAGYWDNIGPRNLGGRTLCIVINPNDTSEIWLGSASGGLWKSNTGGYGVNAWTNVPIGFPVLGVSTIAMNPNNPNEMFIGTGETYAYGTSNNGLVDRTTRGTCGMGIFKTIDGGQTWTQSLNWTYQQQRGIWEIIYNPRNPSVLYAATTEGIYKSGNSGASWNAVLNVQMAMDLEIDRIDTNILYCGVGNLNSSGKGLYKTVNSGASWTALTNGLPAYSSVTGRTMISAYATNPDILMTVISNTFGEIGLFRSVNEGLTWTAGSTQDITDYQGWFAKGLLIHPGDSTQVLCGGVDIYGSTDMGVSFAQRSFYNSSPPQYMHSDVHDIISNPLNPQMVYIATDAGLYRSNDFGQTFTELVDGYVTSQFYIGSVSASDSTMALAGAQDQYTNKYSGSPYWLSVIGGDGSFNAIDPVNNMIQYGSYQYLNIGKSTDQGYNFSSILSTSSSNAAFIAPFVLCPSNVNKLYAGGTALRVSTNAGSSWSVVGSNPIYNNCKALSIAVSATNADSIYLTTAPQSSYPMKIWRSADGGVTRTDISAGLPNRYMREIVVDPTNSLKVYAVLSGFGTGHIYKSVDGGNSWSDISTSLPDLPFHCMAVDPLFPNMLYAGCDFGIFISQDGGLTWNTFNTGLPDAVMIFDLVVSPSDRRLMAFSHGHGVFVRKLSDGLLVGEEGSVINLADLKLFPNPASDYFVLEFNDQLPLNTAVVVYNSQGKRCYSESFISDRIEVPVSDLPNGVYFVKIEYGNASLVRKVVIQH